MQPKPVVLSLLAVLCAGILCFAFLDASEPEALAAPSSGEQASQGEPVTSTGLSELVSAVPVSPMELDRSSVPTDGEEAPTKSSRLVRGRVVDKDSAPVEGAEVLLMAGVRTSRGGMRDRVEKKSVTSDDGTFAFDGLSAARMWVSLEIRHPDFAASSVTETYDEAGDQDVGDVPVLVGATIQGRVLDATGMPISGATLTLAAEGFDWRRMMGMGRRAPEVTTSASGAFQIDKIPPGSYRIRARAAGHQRNATGAITVVDAQQVQLDPIELGPGFALAGVVFDSNARPIENALVEIQGPTRERGQRTDAEGRFRFDHLAAGTFDLEVEAEGYLRNEDLKGIDVPGSWGGLTISMLSGLSIEGAVTDAASGMPVLRYAARVRRLGDLPDPVADQERARQEKAMVEMRQLWRLGGQRTDAQQKRLDELIASTRNARGGGRSRGRGRGRSRDASLPDDPGEVEARPEGKFRFEGLREGVYVVDIGSPDHQTIRTAKIELRQGSPAAPLSVALRGGLNVGGMVSSGDGSPVPDARVELRLVLSDSGPAPAASGVDGSSSATWVSTGPQTTRFMDTQSAADGSFTIANAPAGRYLLRVSADNYATYSTEPFDLRRDRSDLDIEVGALGVIEGRVLGLSAISGEDVKVLVHMGPRVWRGVSVAEDGSYRLSDLEPGDYLVRTYAGDGARQGVIREVYAAARDPEGAKVDVKVVEGGVHRFDLTLAEAVAGEVVGRVFVNGEGAAGYRVSLRKVGNEGQGSGRGVSLGRRRGPSATVEANGDYRIGQVPPGEYSLSVASNRRRRGGEVARATVFVSARDTATVPLIAVDLGSLSGVVVDSPGAPESQGGQSVSGGVVLYKGVIEVPDSSSAGAAEVLRFSAPVRGGKFSFSEVPSGSYLLVLRMGGRESVTQEVFLNAGVQTGVQVSAGKESAAAGAPGR